ncbi:MAG: tRNA (guanosine(37)-N1)-methyltransferase TrmD [Firmicutes bacterium]|nr:tRNA (guanosine(37)-N1)-methyltransferase TrmD [Bacillota bacterium]MBQ3964831.1 tRNA (guanosine(37)-N1)-methyltransferase TrmD [Bacillota bacterium]
MNIDILTIFPEMFAPLKMSMLQRAESQGLLSVNLHNVREYSLDKHRKTDEYPFGGGRGLIMTCDPVFRCLEDIGAEGKRIVYMSPKGRVLDQALAEEYAAEEDLVILCGHYEGIDQRILDGWQMEEVSIGDYILTGGEPAAIVFVDAVARLLPGVLASEEAAYEESIYSGLLEAPQYTKPREYRGMQVPEVLVGGNHKNIHLWQFEQALRLTAERRPDLLERFINQDRELSKEEKKIMDNVLKLL